MSLDSHSHCIPPTPLALGWDRGGHHQLQKECLLGTRGARVSEVYGFTALCSGAPRSGTAMHHLARVSVRLGCGAHWGVRGCDSFPEDLAAAQPGCPPGASGNNSPGRRASPPGKGFSGNLGPTPGRPSTPARPLRAQIPPAADSGGEGTPGSPRALVGGGQRRQFYGAVTIGGP